MRGRRGAPGPIAIRAKFAGQATCGHPFAAGATVTWSRATRNVTACAQCTEQAQRDRAAAEHDERFHESTMPAGMRDW